MIKYFCSQVMNIFEKLLTKKLGEDLLLCKPKRKFSELFEKDIEKTSFYLGELQLLKGSRAMQNWTQFGGNLYDKYSIVFYEK